MEQFVVRGKFKNRTLCKIRKACGTQNPSNLFATRLVLQVRVEEQKFDDALAKLLRAKPQPRKKIKTKGKRGPKLRYL